MIPIIMPQVGQDYPTGTIVKWLKCENESVEKGEIVLQVESEKAVFDVEADDSGILLKTLYEEGAEVDILQPIAYIGQPGETIDETTSEKPDEPVAIPSVTLEEKRTQITPSHKPLISPAAKRAAQKHGLDITRIVGSGPNGRIIKQDVVTALDATLPQKKTQSVAVTKTAQADTVLPFGKMRKKIAERLTLSKQTIPHFHLTTDVDVSDLLQWRKIVNKDQSLHVTVTDLIIKAVATMLPDFERLNALVDSDKTILKKDINIGVAVSVEDGLLVPVIPNTNKLSLRDISELSKMNTKKARCGSINPNHVGTFTISTLGMYDVKNYLPIINIPECAILAVGAAQKQVYPINGNIGIRDIMQLTMACDHRAIDGAYAAKFLSAVKYRMENIAENQEQWTI